jgi:transaldolase
MERIEVYYDGTDIKDNAGDNVTGFTTNISFLKAAGVVDYDAFIRETLTHTKGRPVSFQLYDDTDDEIEVTARKICSYDPDSVFVKIPVIKTTEVSNSDVIKKLHMDNLRINVTAIFTKEQVDSVKDCFGVETPVIISIFGGRINDSGLDCADVVKHAVDTFKSYPNVKILWAACRTVYNIFEAQNQGAHIVTVPGPVIARMNRIGDLSYDASVKTVKQFRQDGIDGNIKFV